jgi:hypothetical protein
MKADNQSPIVKSETFKLKTLIFLDSISVFEQMKVQEMRAGQTIDSIENESRLNFLHIYIYIIQGPICLRIKKEEESHVIIATDVVLCIRTQVKRICG